MYVTNSRGEQGGIFIDDTDEHTPASRSGNWVAFMVISTAEIADITMTKFTNEAALVGVSLAAGRVIYGECSAITLASGVVQMFNYIDPNQKGRRS
jgi:hypothetical protein